MTCWICHEDSQGKERCARCRSDMESLQAFLERAGDPAVPVVLELIKASHPARQKLNEERAAREKAREEKLAAALAAAPPEAAAAYRSGGWRRR